MDTRFDVSRLESLLESAKLLNSSLELDELLSHLVRTVMGRLLVTRAALVVETDGAMRYALVRGVSTLRKGEAYEEPKARAGGLEHIYPIRDASQLLGWIALGNSARGKLDAGEVDFLEALLGLAGSGIANARAHRQVIHSNQELRALLDLGRGLTATTDAEEVAQILMLTLAGRWGVRKHAIFTWKEGKAPIERVKGLDLTADAARSLISKSLEPASLDGLLLLPIVSGEKAAGAVALGAALSGRAYDAADREFAAGLVAQASVALDNAWHFRDTLYRQQIEKELSLAASIQMDLFPKRLPALAHTDISALNRQARQVGGDYYDVLCADGTGAEKAHLLCVADISGKGLSASLLMSNIQATLRALLTPDMPLDRLAVRVNELLYQNTPTNRYATAFFAWYDPITGLVRYVNAGHCEGIVLRAEGKEELLPPTGMPVGLLPNRTFELGETTLAPGDVLLLYSDGVTDAANGEEQDFGLERLVSRLRDAIHLPSQALLEELLQKIDEHASGAPQFDDITMMVLKRREAA